MEVPWESNTYLHRIGRSGRFGSYGIAITLASEGKHLTYATKTSQRYLLIQDQVFDRM